MHDKRISLNMSTVKSHLWLFQLFKNNWTENCRKSVILKTLWFYRKVWKFSELIVWKTPHNIHVTNIFSGWCCNFFGFCLLYSMMTSLADIMENFCVRYLFWLDFISPVPSLDTFEWKQKLFFIERPNSTSQQCFQFLKVMHSSVQR